MAAQAQFSVSDLEVQPGDIETLQLTVTNLGNRTETFTLIPAGLVAGWVRLSPPVVTLFGGSSEIVTVTLRPPRLPSTAAGPTPLTVRIIPQTEPDDATVVESTVQIAAFHDRRVLALQPVQRGHRRATFDFLVENHGNVQASCRLHLIDTSQRLDGDFDPPAVGVEPGAKSVARLRLKAVHRHWRSQARALPFSVEADQQGFETAVAEATFVQTAVVPETIERNLAGVAAVVVLAALAWFVLAKPAIENVAQDAVGSGGSSATVTTNPGDATDSSLPTDGSVPIDNNPAAVNGEAFSQRLVLRVAPSDSDSAEYVVPSGKLLRITDVMLQNPNLDSGAATLSRDDVVLIPWRLENSTGNESVASVSPLVFQSGEKVVFTFACSGVGDPTVGACVPAVLLSGTLVKS